MYQKAIVTFLDILGFADHIKKLDYNSISKILDAVEWFTLPRKRRYSDYESKFITFSDSIIRVRKIKTKTNITYPFGLVFNEILDLVHAQGMLIDFGVLLRGGIAYGDISISGQRVFGPALINAYELESNYAKYPRILISPFIFHELKKNPLLIAKGHDSDTEINFIRDMLKQGDDGIWFIDYGRAIERELDEPEMYPKFLERHRELIIEGVREYKLKDNVLGKYLWLAKYHNQIVQEIKSKSLQRYGIKKRKLIITLKELPTLE